MNLNIDSKVSELHPWQLRGVEAVLDGCRAIFMRYGSGKSRIALLAATCIAKRDSENSSKQSKSTPTYRPVALVFCKIHNCVTWQREIKALFPDSVVNEPPIRNSVVPDKVDFVIAQHSSLRQYRDMWIDYVTNAKPHAIVIDESTVIKNPKAKISAAAGDIAKAYRIHCGSDACTIVMTGNPTPETPQEIFQQYLFAYGTRSPYGTHFYKFLQQWFVQADYGWHLNSLKATKFYGIMRARAILLTEDEHDTLDGVVGIVRIQYTTEHYTLTQEQQALLNRLYDSWELPVNPDIHGDANEVVEEYTYAMSLAAKAQQLVSGFYYTKAVETTNDLETADNVRQTVYLSNNPKLSRLCDIVDQLLEEDKNRRIIVWCKFVAEIIQVYTELLEEQRIVVKGPTPDNLAAFASDNPVGRPNIIVMSLATPEGFNELVGADVEIFYSNTWSAEKRAQAEARINRIGQRARAITYVDLTAPGEMDDAISVAVKAKDTSPNKLVSIVKTILNDRRAHAS